MRISGRSIQFENPSSLGDKLYNQTQNLFNFNGKKVWLFTKEEKTRTTVHYTKERPSSFSLIGKIALIATIVIPAFALLYNLFYFRPVWPIHEIKEDQIPFFRRKVQWQKEIAVPPEIQKKASNLFENHIVVKRNHVNVNDPLESGTL